MAPPYQFFTLNEESLAVVIEQQLGILSRSITLRSKTTSTRYSVDLWGSKLSIYHGDCKYVLLALINKNLLK